MGPGKPRTRLVLRLALAAAVAAAGLALLLAGTGSDAEPSATSEETSGAAEDPAAEDDPGLARRDPADPMALGEADAPVAIVEYADLRCPFCAKYARETMPKLVQQYVDAGLVRYEFRDLPLFGQESLDAAVAARAAAAQGRFWEYFDTLYGAAPNEGHPDMPRAKLLDFAEEAGVPDLAQFRSDLEDDELAAAIADDANGAAGLGINSVPFFAIDNVAVSGAQPLEVFQQVIDERLAAHGVAPDGSAG